LQQKQATFSYIFLQQISHTRNRADVSIQAVVDPTTA